MYANRRNQLAKYLLENSYGAVLIENPSNLYYYTGFSGGEGVFVMDVSNVTKGYLITDSRYYEQVEQECEGVQLVKLDRKTYSQTIMELLDNKTLPFCVAIENTMNLSLYLKLCEVCKHISFAIAQDTIMKSRMVKDEKELACIAKAEAIGDAAFEYILGIMKPGISEREIAFELEYFMKRQGADKLSFDTIVASGPNSSMPHAKISDRIIENHDFVTMDFGCIYKGYCSDMTRTISVGTPSEEMGKVYHIVLEANQRAMHAMKEGVACDVIDAVARDYIYEQGYGGCFGHGLGHGVGLDIHEEPRFSPKCNVVIQENMVITNEPGIYLPGKFGVRIEDLLVIKKNGCEKLSHSREDLIIL